MKNKFRVWCKNKNDWEKNPCVMSQDGNIFQYQHGRLIPCLGDTHIAVFFTGFRDNKRTIEFPRGEELYVGDTVRVWFPGIENHMDVFEEIKMIDGCYGCGDYPLKAVDLTRLKKIGNIFEKKP